MIIALLAGLFVAVSAQAIPVRYEAGHFYAIPQTVDGQPLRLLVDTGGGGAGGMYWISMTASQRLHLRLQQCTFDGESLTVAAPPVYLPGQGLPPSLGRCPGRLMVNQGGYSQDGQLGASYLGTRVWTFDYPRHQLRVEGDHWRAERSAHRLPLGFQRDDLGKVLQHFPRIEVRVDGQSLDMLLDTGATAHPTAEGRAETETVAGEGVTSYITTSMLERWHKTHPDWLLVNNGDDLFAPAFVARLIRVPRVEIGGWLVGPIWFTERPDQGFHQTLDDLMDKPPVGAIGGNVLKYFSFTLDYPQATAWLLCARGCKAVDEHASPSK